MDPALHLSRDLPSNRRLHEGLSAANEQQPVWCLTQCRNTGKTTIQQIYCIIFFIVKYILFTQLYLFFCLTVFGDICPQRAGRLRRVLHQAPRPLKGQWGEKRTALLDRAGGEKHWGGKIIIQTLIYSLQIQYDLCFFHHQTGCEV